MFYFWNYSYCIVYSLYSWKFNSTNTNLKEIKNWLILSSLFNPTLMDELNEQELLYMNIVDAACAIHNDLG